MNKILIVGHPLSGYQEVESLLNACGMSPALPSRREGFMPAQISATLCKAHRASPNLLPGSDDAVQQIDAGPVWHGMALDLMLGNLDQEIWGWADPQSIYLLDYWKNLDPNITFILVYDKPHSVLTQASLNEASAVSAETLSQRSRNWYAYNAALLHFFHRNAERCLLVSSQQVHQSARSYLQQVRARIDAPWSEHMELLSAPETGLTNGENEKIEGGVIASDMPDTLLTDTRAAPATSENATMLYLAEALIQQHPASLQLYDELQSVANLPATVGETAGYTPMDAWQSMAGQQQRLSQSGALSNERQQLVERLSAAQAEAEQLALQGRQQNEQLQEQLTAQAQLATETATQYAAIKAQAEQRAAELGKQAEQLMAELQTVQTAQPVLMQENELLLTQLQRVQGELERYYLEGQQQAQKIQTLQQTEKLANERCEYIEHLTQASSAAQAEAERLAQQRQQQNEQLQEQLTAQAQLATETATQYAAIKAQAEQRAAELGKQAEQLMAELQTVQTAQPVLMQENELLLTQLYQVQGELERYYLENQVLKSSAQTQVKLIKELEPAHYGAADRIKAQLSYRLGVIMIKESRSWTGRLGMLAALVSEAKRFKREKLQMAPIKLPPISSYRDAHDAIRVMQHLSYRLGSTLIAHSHSPLGWIKLPLALSQQVKEFKANKQRLQG